MAQDILTYALVALGAIVVYEICRSLLVRAIAKRVRRGAHEFVRRHDVRLDQFKFMNKAFIEAELMNDPELSEKMVAAARAGGKTMLEIREEVASWIDEIVPFFNLSSYFKLGQPIAGLALKTVYDIKIDKEAAEATARALPPGAVLVYVMNHRSNADYVLVAYGLRRKIALSYAVGEWARVWPLEGLFKSFGSYFIRRRFPNPLYHALLEKYVQLISKRGVSQGVFPEGGLSRDGLLRAPKVGILGYVAGITSDPDFASDVYFVPVGINYDLVLEDRALLGERLGRRPWAPLRFAQKLGSLVLLCLRLPWTLTVNVARLFTSRVKRHGHAAVSFGAPVPLRRLLERAPDFATLDREGRKPHLQQFANDLMDAIGAVVPVTPVPVVARALLEHGEASLSRTELITRVRDLRSVLREHGARFAGSGRLATWAEGRARLDEERAERRSDLLDVDESVIGWDEAEATVEQALAVLTPRKLVRAKGDVVTVVAKDRPVLHYYANSIAQLCGGPVDAPDAPHRVKSK